MKHLIRPLALLFSAIFIFSCASNPPKARPTKYAAALVGHWTGTGSIADEVLLANLEIFENGALLDIPEQGLWSYPLGNIELMNSSISFELFMSGVQQTVKLSLQGDELRGPFSLDDFEGEFVFKRLAAEKIEHPFEVPTADGPLRGQIDFPEKATKPNLVIFVPDSGLIDRNGNVLGSGGQGNTYKLLSDDLLLKGYATARYDKRGVGLSYPLVGEESSLLFEDYAEDLLAIISTLKKDRRFNKIYVLGHGEGALLAAWAIQRPPAKGMGLSLICLSPQSRSVQELLREEVSGYGEESIAEYERVYADILGGGTGDPMPEFLLDVFTPEVIPYWRSWFGFVPSEIYKSLKSPVLLVRGSKEQGSRQQDIEALSKILPQASVVSVPGMNQVLKEGEGDQNSLYYAYLDTEQPISPLLIEELVRFIEAQ